MKPKNLPALGPPAIQVDKAKCTACNVCVEACPQDVYELDEFAVAAYPERCISCGHCVALCPEDAVEHEAYPEGRVKALGARKVPTAAALETLLRARRSVRVFKDKAVPREVVEELVCRALSSYPSAHNLRPVRVLALVNEKVIKKVRDATVEWYRASARRLENPILRTIYGALAVKEDRLGAYALVDDMKRLVEAHDAGRDDLFHDAPAVLVLHAPVATVMPRETAYYAAAQLVMMAAAMGLGTCFVGWLTAAAARNEEIREALGLPEESGVFASLALGYPKYKYRRAIGRDAPEVEWR
ncbi:MAG: 4Fe-4S dicluster domain-containing protein [candidate division Zixibacteria bacterium]|nr:4Fe-4S dicluster domain-containing protein [candidate division Zixibacteria bacterium]